MGCHMPYRAALLAVVFAPLLAACSDGGSDGSGKGGHGTTTSSTSTTSGTGGGGTGGGGGATGTPSHIRVGQFNLREMTTKKLMDAADEQATAAAEVLARFAPDVVNINELQYDIQGVPTSSSPGQPKADAKPGTFGGAAENAKRLADRVRGVDPTADYPYVIQTLGNSGFLWEGSNNGSAVFDLRGWGEWRGRFNTAILSKWPILEDQIRVIADFAWEDLPDNLIAQMETEQGLTVPQGWPLFEKCLNVIPVQIGDEVVHFVLLHPVTPVYDVINTYRNHDELHALQLFLEGKLPGVDPLPEGAKYVVIGDLNADPEDGDGIEGSIQQVLDHPGLTAFFPEGHGTKYSNGARNTYLGGCGLDDGSTVDDPTTHFQLQLDYLLPSKTLGTPTGGEVFFPDFKTAKDDFDLACRASDHRFVYEEIDLAK